MSTRSTVRRVVASLPALLVALAVLLWSAAPASAHAELASTNPPDGGSVDAMPRAVELRFTEGVTAPAAVLVVGPSGRELTLGDPVTFGARLSQRLIESTDGPGAYAVRFQVMSQDGHLVYGATSFTVSGEGSSDTAATGDGDRIGSVVSRPDVLLLGLGLLMLLAITGAGIGRLAREQTGG